MIDHRAGQAVGYVVAVGQQTAHFRAAYPRQAEKRIFAIWGGAFGGGAQSGQDAKGGQSAQGVDLVPLVEVVESVGAYDDFDARAGVFLYQSAHRVDGVAGAWATPLDIQDFDARLQVGESGPAHGQSVGEWGLALAEGVFAAWDDEDTVDAGGEQDIVGGQDVADVGWVERAAKEGESMGIGGHKSTLQKALYESCGGLARALGIHFSSGSHSDSFVALPLGFPLACICLGKVTRALSASNWARRTKGRWTMRNTAAMVLAGGTNFGFSVLTHNRAKSALPFCGHLRVIDFVLTNLSLSGIDHAGIVIQYLPGSLIDHVGVGSAWDFDTTNRRLRLMPPFVGIGKTDWFRGSADAVAQNLDFVNDANCDLVLLLPADNIYQMDYAPLIDFHRKHNAELTIVTTELPKNTPPSHFGYPTVANVGRVTDFVEKPETPPHDRVSTGIYLYSVRTLKRLFGSLPDDHLAHSIPDCAVAPLVREGRVFAYELEGGWDYLPDLPAYVRFHQRFLTGRSQGLPEHQNVMTNMRDRDLASRPSPYFGPISHVENSLISPGCIVEGAVVRSVLSPGVHVAPKAVVRDSILFHDCTVHQGARLDAVVSDKDSVFDAFCQLGASGLDPDNPTVDQMVVVGKGSHVMQGVSLGAGAEVPISQVVSAEWARQYENRSAAQQKSGVPA